MPAFLRGVVTKTGAMSKTVTVTVKRTFEHPKLLKQMEKHKKYLVHDETDRARINDLVTIKLCAPLSARKRFTLESIDRHALDLQEKADVGAETLESAGAQ